MGYRSGKPKQIVEQTSFEDYTNRVLGENTEGWEKEWESHWQDMPEYKQEDLSPYRMIYIFFKNEEDVKDFEQKINQKIHPLRKSYWHPEAEVRHASYKLWVDEHEYDNEFTEFGEETEQYEP